MKFLLKHSLPEDIYCEASSTSWDDHSWCSSSFTASIKREPTCRTIPENFQLPGFIYNSNFHTPFIHHITKTPGHMNYTYSAQTSGLEMGSLPCKLPTKGQEINQHCDQHCTDCTYRRNSSKHSQNQIEFALLSLRCPSHTVWCPFFQTLYIPVHCTPLQFYNLHPSCANACAQSD